MAKSSGSTTSPREPDGWLVCWVNGATLRVVPARRPKRPFPGEKWFTKEGPAVRYLQWRKRWQKQNGQWGKTRLASKAAQAGAAVRGAVQKAQSTRGGSSVDR